MSGEGEEENMREEETDSSLTLRMTGWGLGMTERGPRFYAGAQNDKRVIGVIVGCLE